MPITAVLTNGGSTPYDLSSPLPTGPAGYPVGVTPITAGSGNAANAAAAATMAASAGVTNYIAGFSVTGAGATAAAPVIVTVAGIVQATRSFIYTFAAGSAVGNQPLNVVFDPPIPATAVNTAITVTCPASGLGGTHNAVVCWGFRL